MGESYRYNVALFSQDDIKVFLLYDSIYLKFRNNQNKSMV